MKLMRKSRPKNKQPPRPLLELLLLAPPEDHGDRQDFEYEISRAWDVYRKDHPLGLVPADLAIDLDVGPLSAPGSNTPTNRETVYETLARKLWATGKLAAHCDYHYGEEHKDAAAWTVERGGPDFMVLGRLMHERFHDFKLHWLYRHLSPAEIARGFHEHLYMGELDKDIYEHPHHIYYHKLSLSAWHWLTPYEHGKIAWQRVVQFHKFFMAFTFGLEGFDVTIDHAHHWCNRRGPGEYTGWVTNADGTRSEGTWLDGEFGLIISRGGKHLLTLGVCTTQAGILVNQIQLKQKKGNRWLFQLPKPYFEYAVERLQAAAEEAELPLYLVTGESHARELKKVHAEALKKDKTIAPRIVAIYNQPLDGFYRFGQELSVSALAYRRLARKHAA